MAARADLDRESNGASYTLVVYAVDGGSPVPQTGTTTVSVTVEDVNEDEPRFTRRAYSVFLSDNAAVGTEIVRVSAVDPDDVADLSFGIETAASFGSNGVGVALAKDALARAVQCFRYRFASLHLFCVAFSRSPRERPLTVFSSSAAAQNRRADGRDLRGEPSGPRICCSCRLHGSRGGQTRRHGSSG